VELSLRRLKPETREKIRALAVFHGGFSPFVLATTLQIEQDEAYALGYELRSVGLAEPKEYDYFRIHPALSPYLDQEIEPEQRHKYQNLWAEGMKQFSYFLYEQQGQDTRVAAVLTLMELSNLMALLNFLTAQGIAEETVNFAGALEDLLRYLGRPHILARVSTARQREAEKIGQWSNAAFFNAARIHIERLLERGAFQEAYREAEGLLKKSLEHGQSAYPNADYDIAAAYFLLGRVLYMGGASELALAPLKEAGKQFQAIAESGNRIAAIMTSASLADKGNCLLSLGRLDEAAAAYEEVIKTAEAMGDTRSAAVGRGQLGTVRMLQGRFQEALEVYEAAIKVFEVLQEPGTVASCTYQIGMVYENSGNFDLAEGAYKKSLGIEVQQKNDVGKSGSLNQLGLLYKKMERLEDAAIFFSQAVDITVKLKDMAKEGLARNNLADTLIKLKRYSQARKELQRAIECDKPYGHAAQPWRAYYNLQDLETAEGNMEAAEKARNKAIELYLSYRRARGENHTPSGRLCAMFRQAVAEGKADEFKVVLAEVAGDAKYGVSMRKLASALSWILNGVRDKSVVEDMELHYSHAAEVLLILEEMG